MTLVIWFKAFYQSSLSMNHKRHWLVTNDSVMGGLSLGTVERKGNTCVFSGTLSTKNNGGFTSIFTPVFPCSTAVNSVTICVLGDGNAYQLRFRAKISGYDVAYKIDFKTELNITREYTFHLSELLGVFRGRVIDSAPELKAENISHIGFLITAALVNRKQPQVFSLVIYSIDFNL